MIEKRRLRALHLQFIFNANPIIACLFEKTTTLWYCTGQKTSFYL